jgi:thiamine-monophosphate kinase
MRERELLAHIERRSCGLRAGAGWEVVVGPGDDAAVLTSAGRGRPVVVTVDQLVEGRHFEASTAVDLIARKAVARSVSDVAAMGAEPAWALATGLLPADYAGGDALFDAMARWAGHFGCPLVGGDIASHGSDAGGRTGPLTLTVTVAGTVPEGHAAVLRSGARAGDGVWVSGRIGGSFASGRHLTFEPRIGLGLLASRAGSGVRAGIDVSDGLGMDAARVGRASGVVLEIEESAVPVHPERAGAVLAACADGEDHELLLVIEEGAGEAIARAAGALGVELTRIGRCTERGEPRGDSGGEAGAWIVRADGSRVDAAALGWEHGRDG